MEASNNCNDWEILKQSRLVLEEDVSYWEIDIPAEDENAPKNNQEKTLNALVGSREEGNELTAECFDHLIITKRFSASMPPAEQTVCNYSECLPVVAPQPHESRLLPMETSPAHFIDNQDKVLPKYAAIENNFVPQEPTVSSLQKEKRFRLKKEEKNGMTPEQLYARKKGQGRKSAATYREKQKEKQRTAAEKASDKSEELEELKRKTYGMSRCLLERYELIAKNSNNCGLLFGSIDDFHAKLRNSPPNAASKTNNLEKLKKKVEENERLVKNSKNPTAKSRAKAKLTIAKNQYRAESCELKRKEELWKMKQLEQVEEQLNTWIKQFELEQETRPR